MSESQEVTAAAAAGAAAAVETVQDQQAQEAVTELALNAAEIAAAEAAGAAELAGDASASASQALDTASTAQAASETLAIGLTDVYERIGQVEAKQDEFVAEARQFFAHLAEETAPKNEVQKVEVTNAAKTDDDKTADTGEKQADARSARSAGQAGNTARRHRFGR